MTETKIFRNNRCKGFWEEVSAFTTVTHALVLNASYEPLKIVPWQRAMVMLFQGKVEVLEEHNTFIRTVRFSFRLPSVLRLHNYVRVKKPSCIRFSRENVYVRDEYKCQYCVMKFPSKQLTLDHVVPAVQGGKKTWTNIVTCCITCNQKKGGRTPQQAGMLLLKQPEAPTWLPKLQEDFAYSHTPPGWRTYLFAS